MEKRSIFNGLATGSLRIVASGLLLAIAWALLNAGDALSWVIGVPAILLGVILFERCSSDARPGFSPTGAVIFLCWFLVQSLKGAWQVSCRVLKPTVDVSPGFVTYDMSIPEGPAREIFANCITLLPGTLVVGIQARSLILHVLDINADNHSEVHALEQKVAGVFPRIGTQTKTSDIE